MDSQLLLPVDSRVGNVRASRSDRSGAMVMVQILAGAIGRRSRGIVMIDQRSQKGNAGVHCLVISWFRVSHRGRVN